MQGEVMRASMQGEVMRASMQGEVMRASMQRAQRYSRGVADSLTLGGLGGTTLTFFLHERGLIPFCLGGGAMQHTVTGHEGGTLQGCIIGCARHRGGICWV